MTSNSNEMEQQLRFFSAARRFANNERISAMDERWFRGYLDRNAPPQVAEPGFPQQAVGDARDRNNLRRTNWFNGRYLTAEALSRQDVYFDHRARLNAQALMPGIAWGLGIEGQGLNQLRDRERCGGFAKSAPLTLRRGLAFDGVGRPILVSQDFRFTLADLIGVSLKTPRRVVGGQREFMPCVCLAPDPGGPSGGSAALPSGPYLLVIEAGEVPEGKARVTGDVCGGRRSATCEADLWQGSFGLSLVRFPVDVPLLNDITDVWALRGTLSAYYFDVFEHPLWKRWDPDFPIDGSFARGSGPGRHEGMAIPLALVHLGEDNTALYLDSWIPRRLITATPGEDWHRVRFGAPPRAAAWARIHQFQTMLEERLAQAARNQPTPGVARPGFNLFQGGFRHLPPVGFLPIWPGRPRGTAQAPAQQSRTACTTFASLNGNTQLGQFEGNEAIFHFAIKPIYTHVPSVPIAVPLQAANNTICLNVNSYRSCAVQLNYPAQVVRLQLAVNPSVEVRLYGTGGVDLGAVDLRQVSNNTLQWITVNQPGITAISLQASDDKGVIYLAELCYDYNLASTTAPSPAAPAISRAALAREALRQAESYFAETNVVVYGVVALHDDDILEDLHNVIDKDPLQLELRSVKNDQDGWRNWPTANASSSERLAAVGLAGLLFASQGAVGVYWFLLLLGGLLRSQGMEIDALVNRRTEVVKLVVPLQGLSRQHPLLGALPEDAERQAQQWGLPGPAGLFAASLAGLVRERDIDIAPRLFVVYVKQRLVLLDLVFQLLELLQKIVAFVLAASKPAGPGFVGAIAGPAANQGSNQGLNTSTAAVQPVANVRAMTAASASDYQVAYRALSENDRQLIAATLQQPVVQQLLLQTMATTAPAFAKADRSQAFLEQVAVREGEQPAGNPGERKALALAEVADAWAAEYPDAQVLQLLAAVQPAEQTLELVKRLGAAPGPVAGPSVADGLDLKPPSRFESNTERVLYAGMREGIVARPIKDLALDLPQGSLPDTALVGSLTVGDVLARSPEEAAKLLGGADKLDAVTKAFLGDRQAALEAASGLADGVPAALVAKVETEVAAGKQPDAVLDQLKEKEEAKPEPERDKALLRNLADATTLLRVSGNRIDALAALRRRPEA